MGRYNRVLQLQWCRLCILQHNIVVVDWVTVSFRCVKFEFNEIILNIIFIYNRHYYHHFMQTTIL